MDNEMTIGKWLLTLLISSIPCVGLVMLIVWAVGNGNPVRKTFAQAYLIWTVLVTVIVVILYFAVFATMLAGMSAYGTYMIFQDIEYII